VSVYNTNSADETIQLGRAIAKTLPKKACVLLIGNLGAGKTTLAKGIIQALTSADPNEVVSPTYTLIHEYGNGSVYHIDLYRLETPTQIATLGLDEIFDREAIVLIEWGERFPLLMPSDRIEIRLTGPSADEREVVVTGLP
jgi:tRNA threonylcarbamoyladenosine biosynthesis protein TsaE